MTDFMDDSRHGLQQEFLANSPSSTSYTASTAATSAGPVTPLLLYGLRQESNNFDQSFNLSPTEPFQDPYISPTDDYFLGDLDRYKPLKRNSDGGTHTQSSFDSPDIYNTNQYTPQEDWSAPQSVATSPPTRKLHDFKSRKSSVLSNNLSPSSVSTSASSYDQFLPNSTSGELSGYPFYSTSMASSESPLDSMAEEFDFHDLTTKRDFADSTTKRTRDDGRPDAISACWTSPLCPNHGEGGEPPNPATCGGGCAPYLFGDEPLPDSINNAALDMAIIGVDQLAVNGEPEVNSNQQTQPIVSRPKVSTQNTQQRNNQPRTTKRGESSASLESQGRPLPKTAADMKKSSSPEAAVLESIESHKKNSRQPHNKVEQKYRDSINNQMEALRKVVPSLSENPRACSDGADIEDLPVPSKPSKAVILASATAFIKAQTKERKQLEAENLLLRQRVQALQALVKCDDCSLMQYVVDLNLQNGQR